MACRARLPCTGSWYGWALKRQGRRLGSCPSGLSILRSVARSMPLDLHLHPVDVICLGLAGFDRPDDRKILKEWAERQVGLATS